MCGGLRWREHRNINIITIIMVIKIIDKNYPLLLKKISDAPKKLFYKGNWSAEIFTHCLAVVGTRRMTSYGKRICEELVSQIAGAGITIVSGFMYGVDATAHKAALRAGGKTIAVMPCGIDLIHPADQEDLYKEILANNGLILSEYEGDSQPLLWTYPKRNRIVAGLSQAALVIEAGENSGSLITANFAKKYKRKLFAVPGPLTSEVAKGTNQLIKQGTQMVTSAQDVLDWYRENYKFSFGFTPHPVATGRGHPRHAENLQFSLEFDLEQKILEHLRREPAELDILARTFAMSASELGSALSLMQLSGIISEEQGKFYAL